MIGGAYFGEGFFAGEPAVSSAPAPPDDVPAPVVVSPPALPDARPYVVISRPVAGTAPAGSVAAFRRSLLISRFPLPLRRLIWWIGLNIGRQRGNHFGNLGVTSVSAFGPGELHALSPGPFILSYGVVDTDHRVDVVIRWDHNVTDAAQIAALLTRLERVLNGAIAAEVKHPSSEMDDIRTIMGRFLSVKAEGMLPFPSTIADHLAQVDELLGTSLEIANRDPITQTASNNHGRRRLSRPGAATAGRTGPTRGAPSAPPESRCQTLAHSSRAASGV